MSTESPDWSSIDIDGPRRHQLNRGHYDGVREEKMHPNSKGRLVNTPEYAVAWGVMNRPYYYKQLRKMCSDPEAPSFQYIMGHWKRFDNYYRELCRNGMEPRPPRNDAERRKVISNFSGKVLKRVLINDDYELVKYVSKLGIGSRRKDYSDYRASNPGQKMFLPSPNTVARRFGSWKKFSYEVMKYDVDMIITRYVEESVKSGHWLFLGECDSLGIPLRKAMDVLRPRFFNVLCYRKMELMGGCLPRN